MYYYALNKFGINIDERGGMLLTEHLIRSVLREAQPRKEPLVFGQRRAAVLVPLIEATEGLDVLLTVRTDLVEHHKNQISFPGGVIDETDVSVTEAAKRETFEELGIQPELITIAGPLDEHVTPSGFHICPVVGLIKKLPDLRLNAAEVSEAFTVPFAFFMDGTYREVKQIHFEGRNREVIYYYYGSRVIWGATAAMIDSLVRLIVAGT